MVLLYFFFHLILTVELQMLLKSCTYWFFFWLILGSLPRLSDLAWLRIQDKMLFIETQGLYYVPLQLEDLLFLDEA